jgi:hypothetical protein
VYIYPTNYPEGRLGAPFHGVYKILDNYHEWLVDAYPREQRALYLSIYPFIHYKTVSPREKDKFPVRVMRVSGNSIISYIPSYAPFSPFFPILDNYFKFMGLQLSS